MVRIAYRFFGAGDRADPWLRLSRRLLAERVVALLDHPVSSVLDLGAGDGGVGSELRSLLPGSPRVVMADLSPSPERAGDALEWVRADARRLPFPDSSFDLVLVKDLLHHVSDVPAVLAEIARVTRAGGSCVVVEANRANFVMGVIAAYSDHPHFQAAELDRLLAAGGEIRRSAGANAYPFYPFVRTLSLAGPVWNTLVMLQLAAFKLWPGLAEWAFRRVESRQAVARPAFLLRALRPRRPEVSAPPRRQAGPRR